MLLIEGLWHWFAKCILFHNSDAVVEREKNPFIPVRPSKELSEHETLNIVLKKAYSKRKQVELAHVISSCIDSGRNYLKRDGLEIPDYKDSQLERTILCIQWEDLESVDYIVDKSLLFMKMASTDPNIENNIHQNKRLKQFFLFQALKTQNHQCILSVVSLVKDINSNCFNLKLARTLAQEGQDEAKFQSTDNISLSSAILMYNSNSKLQDDQFLEQRFALLKEKKVSLMEPNEPFGSSVVEQVSSAISGTNLTSDRSATDNEYIHSLSQSNVRNAIAAVMLSIEVESSSVDSRRVCCDNQLEPDGSKTSDAESSYFPDADSSYFSDNSYAESSDETSSINEFEFAYTKSYASISDKSDNASSAKTCINSKSDSEPSSEMCVSDKSDANSSILEVKASENTCVFDTESCDKTCISEVTNPAMASSESSDEECILEVTDPAVASNEGVLKVISNLKAELLKIGANDLALLCHDSNDVVSNLFIGLALFNKGSFHQAIHYFKRTQQMLESKYDCLLSHIASCAVNSLVCYYLGEIEYRLCRFSIAVDHYRESIDSHRESKFNDIPYVPESTKQEKLALALRANNQIGDSIAVYKKAIETTSKDVVSCHTGLGNLYHSTGNHQAALKEYEVAVELAEKQQDYQTLSWVHGNLGNSCFSLGMKEKGILHLKLALDLTYEHDCAPSSISRALNNLGTGYQSLGDCELAGEFYDQALCQAIFGEDKIGQARAYGNIGNVCMVQKDYERAIPHYTEVLDLSNDVSIVYVAHHNRGCAYYELAERKRKQLCEQRQEFQYTGHGPNVKKSQTINSADQECIQSLYKLGLEDLEKVIAHHENTFSSAHIVPQSADLFVSLLETNSKSFARAQDCAYCLGDHHRALLLAEQCHSRTLSELMLKKKTSNLQTPFHSPLTLDQVIDIMHLQEPNVPVVVLSWTGNRLLVWILLYDGKEVTMDTFEQEPDEDLFDESSLDVYLRYSLSRLLSDDLELYGEQTSKIKQQYVLSCEDEGYHSMEMKPDYMTNNETLKHPLTMEMKNVQPTSLVNIEEKDLTAEVKNSYKKIKLSSAEMEEEGAKLQLKNSNKLLGMSSKTKLFKFVAEPLKEIIQNAENSRGISLGKRKLILIPDSTTKLIPFSSLRESDDSASCFGDDYTISFMPSLLTLGIMSQTPPIVINIPSDSRDICIVGDPSTPPFTVNGREWNLGPLPHAKEEAEWVGHYMKSKPLLQHEPTKDVVISRLKSAKLVHLATHGSASQRFLVLAGTTYDTQTTLSISMSRTMVEDEKQLLLYASDVESLSLKAGLVVLSSCDSGRGVIKGDDIQGMARAFLLAGVQSVLTSLWKVPDKSGRFFMQFFYRFLLDGYTSSEALNKASCSIRAFEEFVSMIHWSGYQITGKDVTVQQAISDEERLLKKAFGRGCTPFPCIEVLNNLKKALIDETTTDIQVLCGTADMSLTEPVIDFIVQYADHYSGGVIWINACNEEILEKQMMMMQKIQMTNDKTSLIVVDVCDPALIERAFTIVHNFVQADVIMTLPCPLNSQLVSQIGSRRRLISSYEISALANLQVTQRLVYHIQCGHHLTPGSEEQKALSYLSSMCLGSPVLTDIMSSFIDKCIVKMDDPCEGVKYAKNVFLIALGGIIEYSDEHCSDDTMSRSTAVVLSLVKCLKTEGFLSTQSQILLNCLSLFGPLPIPQSAIVAITEEIIACSSGTTLLTTEVWDDLCSLNLLKRYPDIFSSPNSSDLITKLFYVPGNWLRDEVINIRTSLTSCCYLIHCGANRLIPAILSSQFPPADSVYVLELLKSIQKFISLQELTENILILEAFTTQVCAEWLGISTPGRSTNSVVQSC